MGGMTLGLATDFRGTFLDRTCRVPDRHVVRDQCSPGNSSDICGSQAGGDGCGQALAWGCLPFAPMHNPYVRLPRALASGR